ncbi:armadillo repeat-containing protein 5-like [Haemorhous mexicanus]|uniref:armadillo repeat-containing protein 5-like n=1 Tax=Haemorhous mexicanus TaxID=30427 RepID=UPI0028BF006A|nr:armadillo repeat-containing protein 5-like [Haemorhous mexicanus]
MSESLGWCVEAVRAAAEPSLSRALLALRARHTRRAGGPARFRERGGLGPLLELVGPERPRRVLELALSVLGNCCTEPGCRRQARSLGGVPRLVSLLALPAAPESVWNRVARTLANLALEPEGARAVLDAGAAPLLISLTSTCTTPGCLLSAARALRILGTPQTPQTPPKSPPQDPPLPSPSRALAVSALSARLAALGPADPCCPPLARALRGLLLAPCPPSVAEAATPALGALAALAARPALDPRGSALAALAALGTRGWLRPALGAAGAVEAAVAAVRRGLSQFESGVRALCLLCREAVNRARLRRAGGLGALLGVLRDPRARRWHRPVLLALSAFAWDPPALRALEKILGVI